MGDELLPAQDVYVSTVTRLDVASLREAYRGGLLELEAPTAAGADKQYTWDLHSVVPLNSAGSAIIEGVLVRVPTVELLVIWKRGKWRG